MSVIVTVDLRVDPSKMSDFFRLGAQILPETRGFDGCQRLDVLVDQDKPGAVMFYERWDSREHYQRYYQWREDNGTLAKIGAHLTEAPVIRFFDVVGG